MKLSHARTAPKPGSFRAAFERRTACVRHLAGHAPRGVGFWATRAQRCGAIARQDAGRTLLFCALLLLLTLVPGRAQQSNRTILNVARVSFFEPAVGQEMELDSNQVRTIARAGNAGWSVRKTSSLQTARPGADVTFSITASATTVPAPITVIVDGVPQNLFVLRDAIPVGTKFARIRSVSAGGLALYHLRGAGLHDYTTAPGANVDAVAVAVATLASDEPLSLSFTATLAQNVTQPITNVAQLFHASAPGAPPVATSSNQITIGPIVGAPGIEYRSEDYSRILTSSPLGEPLFVEARAQSCNDDPNVAETDEIILSSARTGDRESFQAIETGPNTGIFRIVPNVPTSAGAARIGDGTMQTVPGDTIIAEITCAEGRVETRIAVDPPALGGAGLFTQKAASRQVAEIGDYVDYTVTVKNVSGFPLDDVVVDDALPFGFSFVEGSARVSTENSGTRKLKPAGGGNNSRLKFSVGELPDGRTVEVSYRVRLGPGAQQGNGENSAQSSSRLYVLRSNIARARVLVQGGVFSDRGIIIGKFFVDANRNRIQDRGEDGVPGVRLFLEDGSYVITDSEGKFNFYGITPRTHVLKVDRTTLPAGAVLEPLGSRNAGVGTTRFVDLKRGEMHKADFAIGNATPAILADVEKRREAAEKAGTEIGTGLGYELPRGEAATGPSDPRSLPASGVLGVGAAQFQGSAVDRREGFVTRGLPPATVGAPVTGTGTSGFSSSLPNSAFEGGNAGGASQAPISTAPGMPPLPAASGINLNSAGTHDPAAPQRDGTFPYEAPTLPAGGVPEGDSTHLQLFPRESIEPGFPSEMGSARDPRAVVGASPATLNSGSAEVAVSNVSGEAPDTAREARALPSSTAPIENSLGFVDLRDGDTLPAAQTNVRVKGQLGGSLELRVNGEKIPLSRVGKKSEHAAAEALVVEFIGLDLDPGINTLQVTQRDPFGNERGRKQISVVAPDKLGRIKISFANDEPVADGKTPTSIRVELVDARDVPVTTRTPLTLESSLGVWQVRDLDGREPGVQVFIEGGRAEYPLVAPIEHGDARLRVSSGAMFAETTLPFLPELRDMLAVGIIEGRINFNKLGQGSIEPLRSGDAFERELREFSASSGDTTAGARAAFFIKGRIKGSYLLTAAYDSDKDTKERLFRDIQPDEFYPVYGDSSVKGFDAQSTGKLYVRIDNKRSYLLYGDFTTQSPSDARSLGNYSRSLTGVREHFENKWISANAWASYDTTRQVIEELPGNGTSGPYLFKTANGLVNSEKIEVLVRDRNQPAVILQTLGKARFTDYEFEPFTGRLLFREPIPTLDENLNPISIRVTYEVDQGGDKFWVYGADAQVKLGERIELGGSAVRDENPLGHYSLYSANVVADLGMRTFLLGEWAYSDDALKGQGHAYRLELRHQSEKLAGRIFWSRADEHFENPSAILSAGRLEAGAQISYKLGPKTRALLQAIDSESLSAGERRGVLVGVEHAFNHRLRLEVGGRYSHESGFAGVINPGSGINFLGSSRAGANDVRDNEVRSLRARLTVPVPFVENARIYGEYEQDVTDFDKRLGAIGGDYQVDDKTRLYARHEFITSLGGPFEINGSQAHYSTVIGVDSAYMKNAALFNEYRVRSGISGREAEGAIGLRNKWHLAEGVRASTTFERIAPVRGVRDDNEVRPESTAVTGAIELTFDPRWKATGRLEYRTSESQDSWLNTLGYAQKITEDWTFLARSIFFRGIGKGAASGDRTEARLQAGAAWRPVETNKWNALGRYEFRYEDDGTGANGKIRRDVHVVSLDVNYQPSADWIWSAHYGGKYVLDKSGGRKDSGAAHLLSSRVLYDFSKRWDAGLNVSALMDRDAVQFGVGPEVGYTIADNVRLALGYNVFGFRDEDLSESEYTDQGFYIALRMKFDETLWQRRKEEE